MRFYLTGMFWLAFTGLNAQTPVVKPTLNEIKTGFENWLQAQEEPAYPDDHIENELDGLESKFMRWYWLMSTRVDAQGNLPDPAIAAREWAAYQNMHPDPAYTRAANWEAVGTAEVPANGGGAGRLNVIRLHPDDPNILFVGAAGGGVWKSPDGGTTWIPLSDQIPVTSIADIAINPLNPDIIYIATGDGYGYEASWQSDNDFWGGVYSCGVMKSTDGGLTWSATGLSYEQENLEIVQRLLIHPENPDVLLASTRNGIFRTDDAGVSWTEVEGSHCHDMAFHAENPDMVYAVGNRDVLISEDAGITWDILKDNLGASGDRMSIETTAANPEYIYVLTGNWSTSFHKSTNAGDTWTSTSSPSSKTTFFGYYDNAFAVSPLDENLIIAGGLEVVGSSNGASSWQKKSNWSNPASDDYVHADNHAFAFHPTNENIIYSGNDGGIFRSDDQGDTWVDLSDGLRIAQIYRLGTSATEPELVLSGWQDNGTNFWDGVSWEEIDVSTWDGMEALIDFTDADIMFLTHQYGALYRSTNRGVSWSYMSASGGGWVTPYVMDPNDNETLYYGANGALYRTTNGGDSWVYKNASLGGQVFAIAVAPSNSNVVYAASLTQIKRSANMGDSWSSITGSLPLDDIGINYIAVSDIDEDRLWVALSGYDAGNKVFYSEDGGDSWVNVSGSLPNVPVNTIVFENGTESRVYVGTDIGVFYRDEFLDDWVPYQTGLPNVMIHELEINYTSSKLVAATYGRGIWQSDLAESPAINTAVTGTSFCVGQAIDVSYASTIGFYPDNVLSAELSDAAGSFAAPVLIGTLVSEEAGGVISCTLPEDAVFSNGYRIRVNSSNLALTGIDNGLDLYIGCAAPDGLTTDGILDVTATLSWNEIDCAEAYTYRYRQVGGDWVAGTTEMTSVTLSGLLPLTLYEWSVQTICLPEPDAVTSSYTANSNFTTLDVQAGINQTEALYAFELYPNPVSTQTQVTYVLPQTASVQLMLYDKAGRQVQQWQPGLQSPGKHNLNLSVTNLPAGTYSLQLWVENESVSIELMIE